MNISHYENPKCERKGHKWRAQSSGVLGTDVCARRRCSAERINPRALPEERCTDCVHRAHPDGPCQNMAYLDPCGCVVLRNSDNDLSVSFWNYRVTRTKEHGEYVFAVREVYYTDGQPHSWSSDPIAPYGESCHEVAEDLVKMQRAVSRPVLDLVGDKPRDMSLEEMARPVEGDIAVVTRRSGKQYVGVYTLAPGIDYFWDAIVPGSGNNQLRDPDVSFKVVGHVSEAGSNE